ncbi:MAG: DUF1800 domain-containing protein [Candidatus Sumerlaeia bacterium]|nr:DUF1800 domain-containing protein [Candidatus Sumerlaeia bacterium]
MAWLDPYAGAWGEEEAAHLARRAGFGARVAELAALAATDRATAVDSFVDFPPVDQALEDAILALPDTTDGLRIKDPVRQNDLVGWWLFRFAKTNQPLQEQFALFLHDTLVSDFPKVATSITTSVNDGNDGSLAGQRCTTGTLAPDPNRKNRILNRMLRDQTNLFRVDGFGSYVELLKKVTRDPAMLFYLDNATNVVGKPQENYGREIMELFSMGVGNYTEADVKAVSRAFTGETVNNLCQADYPFTHLYDATKHDTNPKIVFGDSFNLPGPGEDTDYVVELIANWVSGADITPFHATLPATAIYMAWKFIKWFVHEDVPMDHAAVGELATFFRDSGFNVRETLRTLFNSAFFYDAAYRYAMYKHPIDYCTMALRTLGLEENGYAGTYASNILTMGMGPFNAPNVAGWNHGKAWINSGTLITRFNYANRLSGTGIATDAWVDAILASGEVANESDHAGLVEYFRRRMIQTALRPEEEAALAAFLDGIQSGTGSTTTKYRRKVRGLVHIFMTLPRYQLK